jgi:hypothetical protein
MKLKMIVTTVAAAGMAVAGSVYAADSASLQTQINQLQAQVNAMGNSSTKSGGSSFVRTDSEYTMDMLNNQDSTNRELTILQHRKNGSLASNSVYLGGKGEMYTDIQRVGSKNTSALNMPSANLIFTGTAGKWVTGYLNLQASNPVTLDQQTGKASSTASSVFLNDVYLTIGNLNASPFYGFGGIKTVDFGNFYNPNTVMPTLTQAFFEAAGGQVGMGYFKDLSNGNSLNITTTVMNGGGIATYNSMTSNGNNINDFAVNGTFNGKVAKNMTLHVGAGYINGTGFARTQTASGGQGRVGAVDANAGIMMGNEVQNLKVNAEFVMTTVAVNGLNSGSSFLSNGQNLYGASYIIWGPTTLQNSFQGNGTVKALNLNTAYTTPFMGHRIVLFANYDNVLQNSINRLYMVDAGARMETIHNVWVGATYALAGGKMQNLVGATGTTNLNTSNTILADVTAYF